MNRRKRTSVIAKSAKQGPAKLVPFPRQGVVRLPRVAEARRRIESGWYDRAEVRDSLVDAVLHEIRGR
jgi:hypothetical protein